MFGTTWVCYNNDRILIRGWTVPLNQRFSILVPWNHSTAHFLSFVRRVCGAVGGRSGTEKNRFMSSDVSDESSWLALVLAASHDFLEWVTRELSRSPHNPMWRLQKHVGHIHAAHHSSSKCQARGSIILSTRNWLDCWKWHNSSC